MYLCNSDRVVQVYIVFEFRISPQVHSLWVVVWLWLISVIQCCSQIEILKSLLECPRALQASKAYRKQNDTLWLEPSLWARKIPWEAQKPKGEKMDEILETWEGSQRDWASSRAAKSVTCAEWVINSSNRIQSVAWEMKYLFSFLLTGSLQD